MQKTLIILAGLVFGSLPDTARCQPRPPSPPPLPASPAPVMTPARAPGVQPGPAVLRSTNPASLARIQFENTAHDFGTVKPTDVVKHDYIFTNTGQATLEVTAVRASCGCTTAGDWTHTVEPGKTGRIPIQFNPAGFSGVVAKAITVTCNDPTQPTVPLTIKGTVWKPMDVNPRYAYFTVTDSTPTNMVKISRIVNNTEEPVDVSPPECADKTFKAELKTIRPHKEWEVHVSLVPPVQASRSVVPITLKTTSTNMPTATISAYVMVQPSIQVIPQRLVLPYGPLGPGNRFVLTVRSVSARPLKLSNPTVNAEGVTAAVVETQPGRLFRLEVSFPAGFQVDPRKSLTLSVSSDSPTTPQVVVPIVPATLIAPMPRPVMVPTPTHGATVR